MLVIVGQVGSGFNQAFADVKASCTGGKPIVEELGSDFDRVIENLKWLQDQVATRGFQERKGLLTGTPSAARIKIRHKLFEVMIVLCSMLHII